MVSREIIAGSDCELLITFKGPRIIVRGQGFKSRGL